MPLRPEPRKPIPQPQAGRPVPPPKGPVTFAEAKKVADWYYRETPHISGQFAAIARELRGRGFHVIETTDGITIVIGKYSEHLRWPKKPV